MKKLYRLTKEGVEELGIELDSLIAKRSNIAESIKTARELGDLAENAEYQAARVEQDRNETRISEIEGILQNAEIIKKPRGGNKVQLGSKVKLKNGTTKEFQVVGTVEADPLSGKISDESPIGAALLGKEVGDKVEIQMPNDVVSYQIVDIS
ncbi:MAG TPA: transcription elongation factor GreA [Candidatus Saccharimonadales bacterium]|jgi:transcription elongation factor GreA